MIQLIYGLSIFAWIGIECWVIFREWGKVTNKEDKNTKRAFVALIALGIFVAVNFPRVSSLDIFGNSFYHFFVGTIIIWIGVVFRFWAIRTLGKFFRTTVMIQEDHRVIKTGPYRFLRHPAYTGTLLALTGIAIGIGNWVSLILLEAISFIGINRRIVVEENALLKSLGKDYLEYMKKTKKIIPFIY